MTVRVNKPSFNLREKLSELTSNFGLKGTELARTETVQDARDVISAGRKNLVINGACTISQRLESGSATLTASAINYPVDRFKSYAVGGGEFTIQRSDDAPTGFKNSLMFTVSTAATPLAGAYYVTQNKIEGYDVAHLGWGTDNAKPVTLSFWVKADVTGKYGISFWNQAQNYNYVTSYTINTTDTWEYKTITIPGATAGTWITDTGTGLGIWWDFGTGTTYQTSTTETWGQSGRFTPSNSAQMIATSGAKFRMTGVQLETGTNATEFEHRHYGEELALCQRYYIKYAPVTSKPICTAAAYGTTRAFGVVHLPVSMRDNPTVIASSGTNNFYFFANSNGGGGFSTLTLQETNTNSVTVETSNTLSVTSGHAGWIRTNVGTLAFNAEL